MEIQVFVDERQVIKFAWAYVQKEKRKMTSRMKWLIRNCMSTLFGLIRCSAEGIYLCLMKNETSRA